MGWVCMLDRSESPAALVLLHASRIDMIGYPTAPQDPPLDKSKPLTEITIGSRRILVKGEPPAVALWIYTYQQQTLKQALEIFNEHLKKLTKEKE